MLVENNGYAVLHTAIHERTALWRCDNDEMSVPAKRSVPEVSS